jgi:hypothetical protein
MIKIEHTDVCGWESTIRGMRNPMNSWDKSDSEWDLRSDSVDPVWFYRIGDNDLKLMKSLSKAGLDHGKFLRMINVTCDITAPLYWWKEYDTYKVGTVANSCSTMHKIQAKEFTLDDFSHEHLNASANEVLANVIYLLNAYRSLYLENKNKDDWWQMIQLLPSSYNQKRTVQLNYQVLKSMYFARRNHKLDEWHEFCAWCETLPYFKEICLEGVTDGK